MTADDLVRVRQYLAMALLMVIVLFALPAGAEPKIEGHEYEYEIMNLEDFKSAIPMQPKYDLPIQIKGLACPPSPYRIWEDSNVMSYPNSAMGKIFFKMGGRIGSCSGSLVDHDVVLTAGHCVAQNGKWYSALYFVPGYRNGKAPWGVHRALSAYAWKGWIYLGDHRMDYAMVILEGEPGHTVGILPTTWNEPAEQYWLQTGYPGNPFNGELLWYNESTTGARSYWWGNPAPILTGTGLAPGCSGGPWLINVRGAWHINSVNSMGFNQCPNTIQGPYFDGNFPRILDLAKAYK